jgi:DNA-binding transcriptional regulator YiaG
MSWTGLYERVKGGRAGVAVALGVAESTVWRWETGRIEPSAMVRRAVEALAREVGASSPWVAP